MKIFDLHCDTIGECYNQKKRLRENDLHLSLNRAKHYDEYNQIFAVWIPDELRGKAAADYFDNVADLFYESLEENKDIVSLFGTVVPTSVKAILSCEGGSACGGTIDGLYHLHERGVRLITLTWNSNNEIAAGAFADGGITDFGKEFIKTAHSLGITIDVSHLNSQGFKQLTDIYDKPFIASHSNADVVDTYKGRKRNLQDWQIEEIRQRGGLVGFNFYTEFIEMPDKKGVDALAFQLDYFLNKGCENIIALGSDFDGCYMHEDFSGVEKLDNVYNGLIDLGFGEAILNKMFYENAKSFFDERIEY